MLNLSLSRISLNKSVFIIYLGLHPRRLSLLFKPRRYFSSYQLLMLYKTQMRPTLSINHKWTHSAFISQTSLLLFVFIATMTSVPKSLRVSCFHYLGTSQPTHLSCSYRSYVHHHPSPAQALYSVLFLQNIDSLESSYFLPTVFSL